MPWLKALIPVKEIDFRITEEEASILIAFVAAHSFRNRECFENLHFNFLEALTNRLTVAFEDAKQAEPSNPPMTVQIVQGPEDANAFEKSFP